MKRRAGIYTKYNRKDLIRISAGCALGRIRNLMKYMKSQMKQLIKDNKDLQIRLKDLMDEHELEKSSALRALYHSEVAAGGKYQSAYQALDLPKG